MDCRLWCRRLDDIASGYVFGNDKSCEVEIMTQVHELNITNFNNTGLTTPFPRYTFDLEIKWTNDAGEPQTHGPQTYTFPNDLTDMPLAVRRAFAEQMITAVARVTIGVDSWDQYS